MINPRITRVTEITPVEPPPPPPAPAPSTLALSQRSEVLHTVLGLLALGALAASRMPRFAPYGDAIAGICAALGVGTIAAAKAYLPPRVRAIVEAFSPTPVVVPAAPVVPVLPEVKP